jgi:L-histidine N-alpha-methyltransferase
MTRTASQPPAALSAGNDAFLRDVLRGLSLTCKRLPSKYFYDARGGRLFEQICRLEEYYLTRCELAILRRHGPAIAARLGPGCTLIEYGSGSGRKTDLLLSCLDRPAAYVPVDVNEEQLRQASARLARRHPGLEVVPVAADFTRPFEVPAPARPQKRRVVFFSGSTVGNFEPEEARELLAGVRRLCGPGGGLLIGVDLKKDAAVLERAYDDARGVTAAFNLNLLARINRELGADFRLEDFHHRAFYNPEHGRIEMHLVSRREQTVRVGPAVFAFGAGETICTEYSCKYSLEDFAGLARQAGLEVEETWIERGLYSVQYLRAVGGS